MKKWNAIGIFAVVVAGMILISGCTDTKSANVTPVATPTPQIVYVTVLVTPAPAVNPEVTESPASQNAAMDEAFIDYIFEKQILEGMTKLSSASPGDYDTGSGYNAEPRKEAENLTALLANAPRPVSEKMKAFRSAMIDAVAMMDGTTAGFSRYREAMVTVTDTKFAALSEMPSSGFSVEPAQFRGYGNDIQSFNSTGTGRKFFTLTHDGKSNFAIVLEDERERYISLLVNEIGSYSGKKSANLTIGKYYLDITADGAWTIAITTD
jgi:hypothetical protein